jgi:opacity protein-like surface antigen
VFSGTALAGSDAQRVGGVLGGGVEWAFADRWRVRGEYLYTGFRADSSSSLAGTAGYAGAGAPQREHVVRGGVNYQFEPRPVATGGRS